MESNGTKPNGWQSNRSDSSRGERNGYRPKNWESEPRFRSYSRVRVFFCFKHIISAGGSEEQGSYVKIQLALSSPERLLLTATAWKTMELKVNDHHAENSAGRLSRWERQTTKYALLLLCWRFCFKTFCLSFRIYLLSLCPLSQKLPSQRPLCQK